MKRILALWKRGLLGKIAIIVPSCFFLSMCGVILSPRNSGTPPVNQPVSPASTAQATKPEVSALATQPSSPKPTDIPKPTAVPPTATSAPVGMSRTSPAPINSEMETGDFKLKIIDWIRPADKIILAANQFNTKAESGNEMILITANIACKKKSDQKCLVTPSSFKVITEDGIVKEPSFAMAGIDGYLKTGEFFGGANVTGKVAFEVPAGKVVILEFTDGLFAPDKRYLGIPAKK